MYRSSLTRTRSGRHYSLTAAVVCCSVLTHRFLALTGLEFRSQSTSTCVMEAGVYFTAETSLRLSQCIYHVFVGGSSVASDYASATWLAKEGIQIASKVYLTPINGGTSSLDGTFMLNGDAALGGGGIGGLGRVSFESAGMLEVVGAALADIQLYGSDLVVSASGARPVWLNASFSTLPLL